MTNYTHTGLGSIKPRPVEPPHKSSLVNRIWRWIWLPAFDPQMSDEWRAEHTARTGKE